MQSNPHSQTPPKPTLTYEAMLSKLDELYDKKEVISKELEELNYDIEFLENMIMYRYTKESIRKKR